MADPSTVSIVIPALNEEAAIGDVVSSLRATSPSTPIILLTGWRHQLADRVERPLHVDRLLGKPPRIRELRAALAELTGRRASDRFE